MKRSGSIPENRADLKEESTKEAGITFFLLTKAVNGRREIQQIIEGILHKRKGLEPLKRNQGPVMRRFLISTRVKRTVRLLTVFSAQSCIKTSNFRYLRLFGSKFVICRTTSAANVIPATGGTKAVEPGEYSFHCFFLFLIGIFNWFWLGLLLSNIPVSLWCYVHVIHGAWLLPVDHFCSVDIHYADFRWLRSGAASIAGWWEH